MMRLLPLILTVQSLAWPAFSQDYVISTFAGGGVPQNIKGPQASLGRTPGVAVDSGGNVFMTLREYSVVLRMDAATGVLTLIAGNGTAGFSGDNGLAINAQLSGPTGVAVDGAGNVYVADAGNLRVRRVSNGVISTIAGGGSDQGDNVPATNAYVVVQGIAVNSAGDLFIADYYGRIRKVSNGTITTVAGSATNQGFSGDGGPATSATLGSPYSVALDASGNLFISDTTNNRIRKVSNGLITTIAGNGTRGFGGDNGPAIAAELNTPWGLSVDSSGNLYIADFYNKRIRKVSNGVITTVAGIGGQSIDDGDGALATSASLDSPSGVAIDGRNNLYIANAYDLRIRVVSNSVITTVAGGGAMLGDGGPATNAQFYSPTSVAVDSANNVFVADHFDHRVRKISGSTITTIAGTGPTGFTYGTYGGDNGPAVNAYLREPSGVAVDVTGNVYIGDDDNCRVRKVSNLTITTVAGNGACGFGGDGGPATAAMLGTLNGYGQNVALDTTGNLYIADSGNNRIRKVSLSGIIGTVAGSETAGYSGDGGPASTSQLNGPQGVAVDMAGAVYIADTLNNRIRKFSPGGAITTVAGNGTQGYAGDGGQATNAQLNQPTGVAIDLSGNLFIADEGNGRVRRVSNGVISTIAGNGSTGFGGDGGPATSASMSVSGVAVDLAGNIYVVDWSNERIRLLTPTRIALPSITQNGIVPIFSTIPVIQPASWISIYGSNFANGTSVWDGDFPTSLGGLSVTINNKLAYLWLVSPFQINLQAPDDSTTGVVSVVVTTANGTATSTVTLAPYGPSFSLLGDGKHVAGEIATPDGTGAYGGGTYDLVGPANTFSFTTRPVKPGETLTLYGVGFGPTTPVVPAGRVFAGAASLDSPITIMIGGVKADVAFSGLTQAGLYQFNVIVPPNIAGGDLALTATINGVAAQAGPVVTIQ